jgi:SnoaL-like protein
MVRSVPSITETLDGYMVAFNALDLDGVMTHFADDAVYRPGSGVERVGRAAIREELEPQFELALGAMRFDECDRVVDEKARKIVIRWVCRHDLAYARPTRLAWKLRRVVVGALVGDRFGWEGVDVFHFDDAGKIKRKFTYAGYRQPRLEKQLGVPLPTPSGHTGRA